MRLLTLFLFSAAMLLSACNYEVRQYVRPSDNYVSPYTQWRSLPATLKMNRREITASAAPNYITGRFFPRHNWYGGMCYDQYWGDKRVFVCTTRSFMDRRSVYAELPARKLPHNACGTVAPVYFVGPFQGCAQFQGTVRYHMRYQGRPQYKRRTY